jgi:hypothetical protein
LEETLVIRIENEELKSQLKKYPISKKHEYCEKGSIYSQKNIVIISNIEEFYEQYNCLGEELEAKGKTF